MVDDLANAYGDWSVCLTDFKSSPPVDPSSLHGDGSGQMIATAARNRNSHRLRLLRDGGGAGAAAAERRVVRFLGSLTGGGVSL